jgi:hypothetical protein
MAAPGHDTEPSNHKTGPSAISIVLARAIVSLTPAPSARSTKIVQAVSTDAQTISQYRPRPLQSGLRIIARAHERGMSSARRVAPRQFPSLSAFWIASSNDRNITAPLGNFCGIELTAFAQAVFLEFGKRNAMAIICPAAAVIAHRAPIFRRFCFPMNPSSNHSKNKQDILEATNIFRMRYSPSAQFVGMVRMGPDFPAPPSRKFSKSVRAANVFFEARSCRSIQYQWPS